MSALKQNIGISNDNTKVTKISAQARIDYILRFSKQAILVIDESEQQSTPISSQFLAALPEQHNAAYISLSPKFNNIQIRCRIIEQLYTGELFDPEISLAVSVINLSKKSQQAISIVIETAQHLSLQLLHELSQLAAIAKKANLVVNIVMFGSAQAGKNVATNKNLFENKLTLLSAQSGQLISASSAIFKNSKPKWNFIKQNKWPISALVLLLGLGAGIINLFQIDSVRFSKAIFANNHEEVSLTKALAKPQTMVLSSDGKTFAQISDSITAINSTNIAAIPSEIYSSLINPLPVVSIKVEALPPLPSEIMSAITTVNNDNVQAVDAVVKTSTSLLKIKTTAEQNKLINQLKVGNDYYANNTGYVIQLAAYRDFKLPKTFLDTLSTIDHQVYQRLLNNKPLIVITSLVYADKSAAQSALSLLPKSLLARQPWIKSVRVVNDEINAFLHSQ
jgi:DamX protein